MNPTQGLGCGTGLVSWGYGSYAEELAPTYDGANTLAAFVPDYGNYNNEQFDQTIYGNSAPPYIFINDKKIPGRYGIPILNESITTNWEIYRDRTLQSRVAVESIITTGKTVGGGLSLQASYEGCERLILAAMGFENPAPARLQNEKKGGSPFMVGDGVYQHLFELDDSLTGSSWQLEDILASETTLGEIEDLNWKAGDKKFRRGSLFIDTGFGILCHTGCYINQLTINGSIAGVTMDFDLSARDSHYIEEAGRVWQPAKHIKRILFSDLIFRIKNNDETEFNIFSISEFSIVLNNSLNTSSKSLNGIDFLIDEPARNGRREVSGSFSFPRHNDQTHAFIQHTFNGTSNEPSKFENELWSLSFEFQGPSIIDNEQFLFRIDLPRVRMIAADNLSGPNVNPLKVSFDALKPHTGKNPFIDYYKTDLVKNNEMVITIINSIAGNLLKPFPAPTPSF